MSTKNSSALNALESTQNVWEKMTFGGLVRSLRLSDKISQGNPRQKK